MQKIVETEEYLSTLIPSAGSVDDSHVRLRKCLEDNASSYSCKSDLGCRPCDADDPRHGALTCKSEATEGCMGPRQFVLTVHYLKFQPNRKLKQKRRYDDIPVDLSGQGVRSLR